ncbi:efflux RND transporter periplasmic adaptor subunit [Fundidesulfovibrio butyratiphilus]
MRRSTSIGALVLLAAMGMLVATGCRDGSSQPPAGGMPAMEVVTRTVKVENIPLTIEFMAQVTGSRDVEVRARVGGILLKRDYTEGGFVRKGDVMFEIDPEPYRAALAQSQGELGQAQARLEKAKRDMDRYAKLIKDGVISQKDMDDAQTEYRTSQANLQAAQAKVRQDRINLDYTKVVAPISGMTSKETRSEGSLITTSAEGSLLTTISRTDPAYVNFSIPGSEFLSYRTQFADGRMRYVSGDSFSVRLTLPDGSAYPLEGHINFTDTQVDATTGVVKSRAEIPNPNGTLLPGQFVRAQLLGSELMGAIAIPQAAILQTQQGTIVWVVGQDDTVQMRPVELGRSLGNFRQVDKGLEAGERVIVEGVIKVRPGMKVRVRDAGAPQNQPAKPQGAAG